MGVKVSFIRSSYVSVRVHDGLVSDLGSDEHFLQRLVDLKAIRGWPVTLPFAKNLPIDSGFWSMAAETPLQGPVSLQQAGKLREHFVPLRWANAVVAGKKSPRIEVHLHRFGVVAIATLNLQWERSLPLEEVWSRLAGAEAQSLRVTIGTQAIDTTVREAAREVAISLADNLEEEQSSVLTDCSTRRLVTIIDGESDAPFNKMPPENSPLHVALHHLASGDSVIAAPAAAFVPQWTMAGYAFPPNKMVYALSGGSASLIEAAIRRQPGEVTASDWHRERTLLTAYVCALADLVLTAPESTSGAFRAWEERAAPTLARLYSPARRFLEWGHDPSAILARTGAVTGLRDALDGKLFFNVDFPIGPYPT